MEQQVFDWHQTHPGHLRNTLSNTQSTGHSMSPSSLQTQLSSFKLFIQAWGGGVIVADNSYKPLKSKWHGATSWQFECSTTGASCTRLCPTAGMKNKVSAYRSKLQEEHASLLGMLSFCNFYNVKGGAIWVGCDNEVAVWQASGQSHKISLGQKTCGHHSGHSVDGLSFQKTWYHSDFLWYRRPSRWHPSLLYTWLTFSA
jgi:hypothetical protein